MSADAFIDFDAETVSPPGLPTGRRRTRVGTYSYIESAVVGVPRLPALLPLFTLAFADKLVELRQPLMLRVAFEDGEYFVENDALRVFGCGKTLLQAITALSHDLAYYRNYYGSLRDDEVAGDGADLKRIYESLVDA